ncbi:hypothetical protein [Eisenibacter elegans]|uniref:hypothetical protein n=1 Tax=Eisenibacter elegans TaxID=997 RepID=UPI00040A05EC|nr:hypothetical protein [Eisenibacter elegans]
MENKNRFWPLYWPLLLLTGLVGACIPSTIMPTPEQTGQSFAALEVGNFVDYEVERVDFFLLDAPEVQRFQLREIVVDTFTNIQGSKSYRIERYRRANAQQFWRIDSIWTARIEGAQYIRTENNIPYIRLVFPPRNGLTWDGNQVNALRSQQYVVKELGQERIINNQPFLSTLKVEQANDSSLVELNRAYEIYAQGVGLVEKSLQRFFYCQGNDCIGNNIISFGFTYTQKVTTYGKLSTTPTAILGPTFADYQSGSRQGPTSE